MTRRKWWRIYFMLLFRGDREHIRNSFNAIEHMTPSWGSRRARLCRFTARRFA